MKTKAEDRGLRTKAKQCLCRLSSVFSPLFLGGFLVAVLIAACAVAEPQLKLITGV